MQIKFEELDHNKVYIQNSSNELLLLPESQTNFNYLSNSNFLQNDLFTSNFNSVQSLDLINNLENSTTSVRHSVNSFQQNFENVALNSHHSTENSADSSPEPNRDIFVTMADSSTNGLITSNVTATSEIDEALLRSFEAADRFFDDGQSPIFFASPSAIMPSPEFNPVDKRLGLPPPPKKPLSPYMRFSKGIWQKVKAANPGMSVCEVGASIGRVWREMTDLDKQRFNDEFHCDKVRYDEELQNYLKVNGLQASDITKPRGRKKEAKEKVSRRKSTSKYESNSNLASGSNTSDSSGGLSNGNHNIQLTGQVKLQNGSFMNDMKLLNDSLHAISNNETNFNQENLLMPQNFDDTNEGALTSASDAITASQLLQAELLPHFSQVWANVDFDGDLVANRNTENDSHKANQFSTQNLNNYQSDLPNIVAKSQLGRNTTDANSWLWQQFSAAIDHCTNQQQQQLNGITADVASPSSNFRLPLNSGFNLLSNKNNGFQTTQANENGTAIVDGEKLLLRSALVEKSQEVLRLMRELEQAYGLIHQLKQQNDFFHLQWSILQHHQPTSTSASSTSNNLQIQQFGLAELVSMSSDP